MKMKNLKRWYFEEIGYGLVKAVLIEVKIKSNNGRG
jgi:hypothetical protein